MNKTNTNHISLSTLAGNIKQTLDDNLEISYWVVAEIAEYKVNSYSGHCYLELVEKDKLSNTIKARMRGNIWVASFKMLKSFFETSTGMELSSGLKVLVRCVVEFHQTYGISLNIRDIDPAYTVGEMAIKIQQTLELLSNDGVIDMNRELELPRIVKSVAIISSPNAAGYQDFTNQLNNNSHAYKFNVKLYEAVMQGDKASDSILDALNAIFDSSMQYDAVIILRGGGAVLDLNCFNDYDLCFTAAQFPLPIITAIGHEKDETVLDVVAHTKLKTPTAAAEFLLNRFLEFESIINTFGDKLGNILREKLMYEKNHLSLLSSQLKPLVHQRIDLSRFYLRQQLQYITSETKQRIAENLSLVKTIELSFGKGAQRFTTMQLNALSGYTKQIQKGVNQLITTQKNVLDEAHLKIEYQNPKHILAKGYTLTTKNGELVTNSTELKKGDSIETLFGDGKKSSTVD